MGLIKAAIYAGAGIYVFNKLTKRDTNHKCCNANSHPPNCSRHSQYPEFPDTDIKESPRGYREYEHDYDYTYSTEYRGAPKAAMTSTQERRQFPIQAERQNSPVPFDDQHGSAYPEGQSQGRPLYLKNSTSLERPGEYPIDEKKVIA